MGDPQSPKDECEKFLARQHPAVRAVLQGDHRSPQILSFLTAKGGIEKLYKAQDKFEELLKRCPRHLREYRARAEENAIQIARYRLSYLGPVKSGRPASREVEELGRKAAKLFDKGMTGGEVAKHLCPRRKDDPKHRCNKLCADRIRQNAKPYLSSKQTRENSRKFTRAK